MKTNMGSADRIIRLFIALVFGLMYFTNFATGVTGTILLVIAIVFVLTSAFAFCPLYAPFGINTCSLKEKN